MMDKESVNRLHNILQEAANLIEIVVKNEERPNNNNTSIERNISIESRPGPSRLANARERSQSLNQAISNPRYDRAPTDTDVKQIDTNERVNRLTEVRRIFEPYSASSSNNHRNSTRRQSRVNGARGIASRIWNQNVFLLDKFCINVPLNTVRADLTKSGMGSEVIKFDQSMNSKDVEHSIRATYPILNEKISFELVKSSGPGRAQPLVKLIGSNAIPSALEIFASINRTAVLYVRPLTKILENESVIENDKEDFAEPDLNLNLNESTHSIEKEVNTIENEEYEEEELTISDLRKRIYAENPGVQPVIVQRDFFYSNLLGVYKHPRFNLLMEPDLTFIGEQGADSGALSKEFFWMGMETLLKQKHLDKIILFEGENDHKLPVVDSALLQNNIYKSIAKFMVHSALHTGVAFVGLSPVFSYYIFAEDPLDEMEVQVSILDVPDYEVRNILNMIEMWDKDAPINDVNEIKMLAVNSGVTFNITYNDKHYVYDSILRHHVILKRKAQLDVFRSEFMKSPLYNYIKGRPYLISSVFIREKDNEIPLGVILNKIKLKSTELTPERIGIYKEFLEVIRETISEDNIKIRDLLKAWTGWPYLPEDDLEVKVEDEEFRVHACSSEIVVPLRANAELMRKNINMLINFGTTGFGDI